MIDRHKLNLCPHSTILNYVFLCYGRFDYELSELVKDNNCPQLQRQVGLQYQGRLARSFKSYFRFLYEVIQLIKWALARENLTLLHANKKGVDQTAHLRSLISTFFFVFYKVMFLNFVLAIF